MPSAVRRRQGHARSYAVLTSLDRQPDFFANGAAMVPLANPGHSLRNAWIHEVSLRSPRPAMHRDGIRDRDDHQVFPDKRKNRRRSYHTLSGRTEGPRPAL